jgi:hypothetical protein
MGNDVFENMTAGLMAIDNKAKRAYSITEAEYSEWKQVFTFEGIKGSRYGQSFCNHFGIQDYRVYHEQNWQRCDQIIQSYWLIKLHTE